MFSTLTDSELLQLYYLGNKAWIAANYILIVPFLISCVVRFFNQDINKHLWTDHLGRAMLLFTTGYYVFDVWIKYEVDGVDSVCEKAFFLHHMSSIVMLPLLIINDYIPWWVCPIGFMHGFCLIFPEAELLNYVYAACLFIYQHGIYQPPYCNLKGYKVLQLGINFIWCFAVMLLLGGCSNYLPTGPDDF